jgi:hypothetical protein
VDFIESLPILAFVGESAISLARRLDYLAGVSDSSTQVANRGCDLESVTSFRLGT